uniref:Rho-GAP domain-containing protein n=1 Tax=Anopheles melas TaxID=34690 RepID=A0A182TY21_9DIPT
MSLPGHTQRLLVLLFGTFRVIASNSERADTGMTSEALGVSVAPSFFQSCVSDGKTARMKDVLRFKVSKWGNFCFGVLMQPKATGFLCCKTIRPLSIALSPSSYVYRVFQGFS